MEKINKKLLQSESKILTYILLSICIIAALYPFFSVGFTTGDDLEYYVTSLRSFAYWLEDAQIYAQSAGRFHYLLVKPLYLIPYLVDNFLYTKLIQYIFLLLSYGIFSFFIYKLFKSKQLGFLLFILLVVGTSITYNNHVPTIAYPFYFSFSFTLCICSLLLFIKYCETNKYKLVLCGAAVFFITSLFYETYILFLLFFCIFLFFRNIKTFGWKKIWVNQQFYKEIVPYISCGILYMALYVSYRWYLIHFGIVDSFYNGSSVAQNFSISHYFQILERCTFFALPARNYFVYCNDLFLNSSLLSGHINSILFVLTHANPLTYIEALAACALFFIFTNQKLINISYTKFLAGIAIALFVAFFSHTLIGVADKYNSEWYSWMRGYVTSFYSIFCINLVIILAVFSLLSIIKSKVLFHLNQIILCAGLFVMIVLVSYTNFGLSKEWERSQNRFTALNEIIDTQYFKSIPNNSIFYFEDLLNKDSWGGEITKDNYIRTIPNIVEIKSGKHYIWEYENEGLKQALLEHPDSQVFFFCKGETIKACEMMLCISNLGTAQEVLPLWPDSISSNCTDVFYLSPTKDYALIYTQKEASQSIFSSRDTLQSAEGLNVVNVQHNLINQKLTLVSIQSSHLDPRGFSISNMCIGNSKYIRVE